MDDADMEYAMIDGTVVRVPRHGQQMVRSPPTTYADIPSSASRHLT